MKWFVALMIVVLTACSMNSKEDRYISVRAFYAEDNYLDIDYALSSLRTGDANIVKNWVSLPENLYQAVSIAGRTIGEGFAVSPGFSASSDGLTTLTLDTEFPLDTVTIQDGGGWTTTTVTFHFVDNQRTTFSVPNAVYYKLNTSSFSAVRLCDINDRGSGLAWSDSASASLSYRPFAELTGEDAYVVVSSSSGTFIGYLTDAGALLTEQTPFGTLSFVPGMGIDLSGFSY